MKFCELLSDQGRSESGQHVSSGYNSVAQRHDFESALRVIKKRCFPVRLNHPVASCQNRFTFVILSARPCIIWSTKPDNLALFKPGRGGRGEKRPPLYWFFAHPRKEITGKTAIFLFFIIMNVKRLFIP